MLSRFAVLAALTLAATAFAPLALAQGGYFSAIPDLPVPPAMSEDQDVFAGQFSGDQGRLITATAHGPTAPEALQSFYTQALPALGWSLVPQPRADELVFVRDRERLTLRAERRTDGTELRVRLIARAAPAGGD